MINKFRKLWENKIKLFKTPFFREKLSDYIYLILFGIYMTRYYLGTTMFEIQWSDNFFPYMQIFIVVSILFRYLSVEPFNLKDTIILLVIFPTLLTSYQNTNYSELLLTALLIVGAYGIGYQRIFKVYLMISVPITIWTIIASQTGEITDLVYHQGERIRESFGFIYPTDFAAHIFFIIMIWVLLRQLKCTYFELGIMLAIVLFLHFNCDTRCSEIAILLMILLVIGMKISHSIKRTLPFQPALLKIIKTGCFLSPFAFSTIMIFLCRFYNPENALMVYLNNILSSRLMLGKRTFDDYDTTLWGQYVEMYGKGGKLEAPEYYSFIDCSYINILMRFGLCVFIIVLFSIEIVMLKNINNTFVLVTLTIVCLTSMIEHHLFEFHYNIFIILPLASFQHDKKENIRYPFLPEYSATDS